MFKVAARPTWKHTVTISVPVDGGFENQDCRVTFRQASADAEAMGASDPKALVDDIILRIDDLIDDEGKPLDWSDDVKRQVIALPYATVAIVRAYYRSISGARAGNSDGLGGLGRAAS